MKKKVLAGGGGGFMGVGPARYLNELEVFTGITNVAHYFDLIIGTSVFAMIAACLACGHNARAVLALFDEHLNGIFGTKRLQGRVGKGPLYDDRYVTRLLKQVFGSVTMDKTSTPLYVTAWDARRRDIKVFGPKDVDVPVWYAVRCSMAASTFFEGVQGYEVINGVFRLCGGTRYKDGGFAANVPLVHGISAMVNEHNEDAHNIQAVCMVTSGRTPDVENIEPNMFVTTELSRVIVPALTAGNSSDQEYLARAMIGSDDLFFIRPKCKDYKLDELDRADEVEAVWNDQYERDYGELIRFLKRA